MPTVSVRRIVWTDRAPPRGRGRRSARPARRSADPVGEVVGGPRPSVARTTVARTAFAPPTGALRSAGGVRPGFAGRPRGTGPSRAHHPRATTRQGGRIG